MILSAGTMLQDRYEILEKIGSGGMSEVYKAKCHKLNRLVAIKVLKSEFTSDAGFVSKFKIAKWHISDYNIKKVVRKINCFITLCFYVIFLIHLLSYSG